MPKEKRVKKIQFNDSGTMVKLVFTDKTESVWYTSKEYALQEIFKYIDGNKLEQADAVLLMAKQILDAENLAWKHGDDLGTGEMFSILLQAALYVRGLGPEPIKFGRFGLRVLNFDTFSNKIENMKDLGVLKQIINNPNIDTAVWRISEDGKHARIQLPRFMSTAFESKEQAHTWVKLAHKYHHLTDTEKQEMTTQIDNCVLPLKMKKKK